ncbi:unnamed protein product [Nippostrongylus brasiliensis]|uniref:Secreted protein n=1 Tax=Nippostrongylus brasiliensis TaxID=27835 RepID=A0A0N4YUG7_NIPBR|nr:unnamed protein product [Nippostrongylus brasiliensis]
MLRKVFLILLLISVIRGILLFPYTRFRRLKYLGYPDDDRVGCEIRIFNVSLEALLQHLNAMDDVIFEGVIFTQELYYCF